MKLNCERKECLTRPRRKKIIHWPNCNEKKKKAWTFFNRTCLKNYSALYNHYRGLNVLQKWRWPHSFLFRLWIITSVFNSSASNRKKFLISKKYIVERERVILAMYSLTLNMWWHTKCKNSIPPSSPSENCHSY